MTTPPDPALGGLDEELARFTALAADVSQTNVTRFRASTTARTIRHCLYVLRGVDIDPARLRTNQ